MYQYKVGDKIDGLKKSNEGVFFDLSDEGAVLLIHMNNPSKAEIQAIKKKV